MNEFEENDQGITPELIKDIVDNVKFISFIKEPGEGATEEEIQEYNNLIQLFEVYVEMICHNILIYTNRDMFPSELKYVVARMVKEQFIVDDTNKPNAQVQTITKMSEAGRSVDFGINSTVSAYLQQLAASQVQSSKVLLTRYKLLYRTSKAH